MKRFVSVIAFAVVTATFQSLLTPSTKVLAACGPGVSGTCTAGVDPVTGVPGVSVDNCCPGYYAYRKTALALTCYCRRSNDSLQSFLNVANGVLMPASVVLGIFIIILAGYKILTSQGNPQELQIGKENLTSGIIGLIFVLMAVSVLRVIIKALITGDTNPF